MKRKIETKEEFLSWAKEVNTCLSVKVKCDLQDVFARSNFDDLKKMFLATDNEYDKQLLTLSICKAQGEETAYRFMKSWARRQAQICIDENEANIQAEYDKLNKAIYAFQDERAGIEKELREAKEEVLAYQLECERLNKRLNEEVQERERLGNVVFKQTEELNEAYKEVEKASQFKAYLRSALSPVIQ
jgi:predicted  nucleic acid-binding Zn-ribbon protein